MRSFKRSAASVIALMAMSAAGMGSATAEEMPIFRVDPVAVDQGEAQALLSKIAGTPKSAKPTLQLQQKQTCPTLRAQPQLRNDKVLQLEQQNPKLQLSICQVLKHIKKQEHLIWQ